MPAVQRIHMHERERALSSDEGLSQVVVLMDTLSRGATPCALGDIAVEHLASGGKRVRARLALAAMEALGGSRMRAMPWAAAVELVHNASLIHDDLEDGDEQRRGRPTVWVQHGTAQAINAGDLMLALPYRAAVRSDTDDATRWRLCESLAWAVERMARGQSLELELVQRMDDAEQLGAGYVQTAEDKTGALFAATIEGAALLAGCVPERARALGAAYLALGVLFQMQDDVLDLFGDKGRGQRGNDLREGKVSALVVEHVRLHPADAPWLHSLLTTPRALTPDHMIEDAIVRFERHGALQACLDRMQALAAHVVEESHRHGNADFACISEALIGLVLAPIQPCLVRNEPSPLRASAVAP